MHASQSFDLCFWACSLSHNCDHSASFVKECNAFKKNIYTNYGNIYEDEMFIEEDSVSYWSCTKCTYNNLERDLRCAICSTPFKPTNTPTRYMSDTITFGDYLPSTLDTLVHLDDDTDELVQFAILHSLDDYVPNQTEMKLNEGAGNISNICKKCVE